MVEKTPEEIYEIWYSSLKQRLDDLDSPVWNDSLYLTLKKKGYLKEEHTLEMFNQYVRENNKPTSKLKKKISRMLDKREMAQEIIKEQPLFYDSARNWWIWNAGEYRWERVDETDILNAVSDCSECSTINSKERNEILEALQQVSRQNKPKEIKPSWIQFRDKIVDVLNGEEIEASPQFFVTNPIPWEFHPERIYHTPIMDRIFEEWVGAEMVKTLYEILSYCLIPDMPIHRIFCFIGAGMNGKSKFLELLRRFIGKSNCCSTELDTLLQSRFEVTRLHKKLVCQMGETNFNEMNKTSLLKKLSGGDLIGFEYKNKDTFEDKNYAKIIIATNSLPATTDKTIGFYRRWMIIDFPNQFSEQRDVLADIPDEEYQSLAVKCFLMLKDLLEQRKFTNEGSIEERIVKYESKSNFLEAFCREFVEDSINSHISVSDFNKRFEQWCKANRHREMTEMATSTYLKKLGWEQERKYFSWLFDGKGGQMRIWMGKKWKE